MTMKAPSIYSCLLNWDILRELSRFAVGPDAEGNERECGVEVRGVRGVTCRVTCKPDPEVRKSRMCRSHASQCERAEAICQQNVCAV